MIRNHHFGTIAEYIAWKRRRRKRNEILLFIFMVALGELASWAVVHCRQGCDFTVKEEPPVEFIMPGPPTVPAPVPVPHRGKHEAPERI